MLMYAVLTAGLLTFASGDFSADFNGYPNKHQLHGEDGWRGWDNDSSKGAKTTNSERHSNPRAVDITNTSDLVQVFSGATSGQWEFKAWQYIPTSATGTETYLGLLNTYSDGGTKNWSTKIKCDLSANTVSDCLGGATGSVTLVRNAWKMIQVDIDLDAKTQTVYYDGSKVTTMAWERTSGAVIAIAALDLCGSTANHVYYDDISLTNVTPATTVPVKITRWREVTPDE